MKSPTKLSRRRSAGGVDVLVAKLGILAAVALLGLRLFASQPFLLVIPLAIGTGSGLYLLTGREKRARTEWLTLPRSVTGYLPSVVVLGLAALVVGTRLAGTRTVPVYLLIGAIGAVIFGQILLVEEDGVTPGGILFEILAAAVVIRLSALFVTPGYIGVDIWIHALEFTDGIARQGTLEALSGTKYLMAPFYHVIGATGTLVFGSVRAGIYLTLGVLVPLSAVFVYATGKFLVPARWALLATALYAFSDQFIRWGLHVIPTSLGLAFFLALAYLVARVFYDIDLRAIALAFVVSLAVVFTHQLSTAIVLVFLAVAAVVAVVLPSIDTEGRVTHASTKAVALGGLFAYTLITTLVVWAYTPFSGGSTFLWRELAVVGSAITEDAGLLNLAGGGGGGGGATGGSSFAWLTPYVELFGFALLLAAAVVGGLLLLRRNDTPGLALTLVFAGAVMFVVVFGLSLFGVRALLPGRWIAFLYAPMALLAAVGIYQLFRGGSRPLVMVAFIVLAVGYPTTMVVAEKATLDSPAFDDRHTRFAHTGAEIGAVHTISEVRPAAESGVVRTDHPYDELFEAIGGYEDGTLVLGPDGPVGTDAAVARDYQARGPDRIERTDELTGAGANPAALVCPETWNKTFANDEVRLCTDGTPGGET